jgi:hypothetical protein
LKYALSIFLLITTCINHLNIVELYNYLGHSQKISLNNAVNDSSKQEEDAAQKEIKENLEGQGKYCSNNYFLNHRFFCSLENQRFYIANTALNLHPYCDDILQPPEFS